MNRPLQISFLLMMLMGWIVTASSAHAALPASVNGQAMPSLAPMLDNVTPAVVHIATESYSRRRASSMDDPLFEFFFGKPKQQRERRSQGLGSGVIIDAAKGHIVTNQHVIDGADDIKITLKDGRTFSAKVIGADPDADIAVIQIKASGLTEVPLSDSAALRVGDFVVAIGNPFGLEQTVTSGIVSGLGRSGLGIESYEDFIQTDASINPGNSGGALVNLKGELVGINTAILGPNGGNIGIGFAIPINMAKSIATQLVEFGEVNRGRLGIGIQDLTPDLANAFNIQSNQGAVVSQIEQGSPAERAGLQVGDVISSVNGSPVRGASQLRNSVGLLRVGTKVSLGLIRDGKSLELTAVIEEKPSASLEGVKVSEHLNGASFEVANVEGEDLLIISAIESGSPAARTGLVEGDVILSVNRKRVKSLDEMREAVSANSRAMLLNILRDGRGLFLLIQ